MNEISIPEKVYRCLPLTEQQVERVFKKYTLDYSPNAVSHYIRYFHRYYQENIMQKPVSPLIKGVKEFLTDPRHGTFIYTDGLQKLTLVKPDGEEIYTFNADPMIGAFYLMAGDYTTSF